MPGPNEKDVRINVIIDEDVRGAKKASKALAETRQEADKTGKSFKMLSGSTKELEAELKTLTEQRAAASKRYLQTGNQEYLAEERRIGRQIGLYKKLLANMGGGEKSAGLDIGGMFKGGGTPAMIGGIGAVVAAALPALGAMIGGAISGAIVTVGIGGGIAAATKDASVRASARDFGQTISREFFASGDAFVTPVRNALDSLEADFQDLDLEAAFAKAAPAADEFADGIGALAKNFMPGFNKALSRSGPFTEELADGLAGLGYALGTMVDDMSSSEGAVEGLELLFRTINGTLIGLGKTVNFLSDTWDVYTDALAGVSGFMEDVPAWLQGPMQQFWQQTNDTMEHMNQAGLDAAGGIEAVGDASGDAAPKAAALAEGLAKVNAGLKTQLEIMGNVDDTKIALNQGFLAFTQTLKENGKEWGSNTEEGLANQEALRGMVDLIIARRDAEIAASDGSAQAIAKINLQYDKTLDKLEKMARDAGITEAQFADLAGDYRIRFIIDQVVGKQVVAWSELRNQERRAEANADAFGGGFQVNTPVGILAPASGVGAGKPKEFASGGDTPAGAIYKVHKDELLFSNRSHYVATAAQSRAMSSGGGGWSGGMTMVVAPGAGQGIVQAIVSELQGYITLQGGDVQQALGRSYS